MKSDAFSIIKGRYIVLIWLFPFIYMPGIETLIKFFLDSSSEWYWSEIIYFYYYHLFITIFIIILIYFGKPNWLTMLGKIKQKELLPSLKLTAFIFIFSIATAYLLFYPLSFIIPEFVQYWFIDIAPSIYSSKGIYPIIPNLLSFISLVILAPFLEEFIFRGFLLHRWNKKWGLMHAILLSSLLFGILHPDPIGAIAFGIAMCIIYLKTQSLWVPIICHAANNLVVWLMEVGSFSYYGPEYIYTLQEFQDDWYLGIITSVITILWLYFYFIKPKSNRKWCLPNA